MMKLKYSPLWQTNYNRPKTEGASAKIIPYRFHRPNNQSAWYLGLVAEVDGYYYPTHIWSTCKIDVEIQESKRMLPKVTYAAGPEGEYPTESEAKAAIEEWQNTLKKVGIIEEDSQLW